MQRLVIYGAGGFAVELLTAARSDPRPIVFADDRGGEPIYGRTIIAPAEITDQDEVVIAIADDRVRKRIATNPWRFGRVIAPTAVIGPGVEIGEGAILCDHTIITARAKVGRHFHGNIYSYVAHDCIIGDFVTFAPQAACNGNVHVGDGAYLGTGAVTKQGLPDRPLVIGPRAVVGMGAVVTKDVPPGVTVIGNPARLLQKLAAVG